MKRNDFLITLLIAFIWVALYSINHFLFGFSKVTPWISLIFIPSGFKMASAAIYRLRSVIGLFLGAMATGHIFLKEFSLVDVAMFSVFSATLPFLTLTIVEQFLPFKHSLSNLSMKHILSYATIFSVLNAIFHLSYRYHVLFLRDAHQVHEFVSMVVGDFLGILLFMLIISRLMKRFNPRFN